MMTLISALHLTYAGFTFGQLGLQLENGLVEIFLSIDVRNIGAGVMRPGRAAPASGLRGCGGAAGRVARTWLLHHNSLALELT